MKQSLYSAVVTLVLLCSAVWPAAAHGQQVMPGVDELSPASRRLLVAVPSAAPLIKEPSDWISSSPTVGDRGRGARAVRAQSTQGARTERGVGRKVLGAAVGAAGGFFAGGYLGAAIEGDRCHCDDPGLKGAVIGAPIGAVVGGLLGAFYLF